MRMSCSYGFHLKFLIVLIILYFFFSFVICYYARISSEFLRFTSIALIALSINEDFTYLPSLTIELNTLLPSLTLKSIILPPSFAIKSNIQSP